MRKLEYNIAVLKDIRIAMVGVLDEIDDCCSGSRERRLSDQHAAHAYNVKRVTLWQSGGAIAPRERAGALCCAFFSASYRC